MNEAVIGRLRGELAGLREQGLYKTERVLASPQGGVVRAGDRDVINLCANNYLGLANHPAVRAAAQRAIEQHGYGMASVRFICGTQTSHKALEEQLARCLGTEDVILYSSCFDANGGLFETLLDERDAVISDALNHASIIDGIRLCKAQRYRYANSDMRELEQCLKQSSTARTRLIATDGVFSMDGFIAKLAEICDLASRYDALVMVDDSHATGFMGATGRGTAEHCGVAERVDILTGTLGKALGGGTGGYVAAPRELVEWLRQRSRPYLFSNSIPPVVAAASLAVLDLLDRTPQLRAQLLENTRFFRSGLESAGFDLKPGEHPIIPVMIGDAALAARMAEIGSEVNGLKSGDRVSGEGHITCGYCRNCRAGRRHLCRNTVGVGVNRPGAFAQYLAIPAGNAFKLTDSITDDIAAILDPFGNATHTALAFNVVGEDVLITGAGPIGIMATAVARFTGARHVVITDVNDYRLELARRMGATRAINVRRDSLDLTMQDLGMQEGFDVGLEMSGNATALREMTRTMHHGGSGASLDIPHERPAIAWLHG